MSIEPRTIARLRDALMQSGRRPSLVVSSAYDSLTRAGLLSTEELATMDRLDALAETMFMAMAADGQLDEPEYAVIRGAIRDLSDHLLREGTIRVMLDNYHGKLLELGWENRLNEVCEVLKQDAGEAEIALTLAAAVTLADHQILPTEAEFLRNLAEWLGIDREQARRIFAEVEADRA